MNCYMGARDPGLGPIPDTTTNYVLFYAKDTDIPRPVPNVGYDGGGRTQYQ